MSRAPFVVLPSRKPEFWAAVERHRKAEGKTAKKADPVEAAPVKKAKKGKRK
jgi:hypothetical protein